MEIPGYQRRQRRIGDTRREDGFWEDVYIEEPDRQMQTLLCATCGLPFEVPAIGSAQGNHSYEWFVPHVTAPDSLYLSAPKPVTYHTARAVVRLWKDAPDSTPRRIWQAIP